MRRTRYLTRLALSFCLLSLTASGGAAAWSYKDAAAPYAGTTIRVLDEITPLQETMKTLVPEFTAATGIEVEYELLNHFEVINKGQADMLSGRGYYDAVMLHGLQLGPMLAAKAIQPIDDLLADAALSNPQLDLKDMIEPSFSSLVKHGGKTYGFNNWNYNMVYWARGDLLEHADEKAAFEARYGYPLAAAKTMQQMLDIAEFFTRKSGDTLAGEVLSEDFYGIVLEGVAGGTTMPAVWQNLLQNWGGGLFDAAGRPAFDTPQNIAALQYWAKLWEYSPPGQAEYSLIDVPTVMGNGIAAQSLAWSDFVLGVDKPGASPLAGKFVYSGIPANPSFAGPRSASAEPSLVAISHASENPQAVYLFMQWMIDKDTQRKLIEAGGGGVPIRYSSLELPAMKEGPQAGLVAAMASTLEVAAAKPKLPDFFQIYDALTPLIQEVGLGTLSPVDAAAQGQQKLLDICSECAL